MRYSEEKPSAVAVADPVEPVTEVAPDSHSAKQQKKAEKKVVKERKKQEKKERKAAKKQAYANGEKRRWRFGDRYDGYRVRSLTPYSQVSPYIMQIRSDAQNHFEDEIDITDIESYIRAKRLKGQQNLGLLHVFLAAYVRCVSQRPALNRFIAGDRIYSRHNIEVVMVIKKKMTSAAPDTAVKCYFKPEDTINDVYEKWNKLIEDTLSTEENTSFDNAAKALAYIPGILLRLVVRILRVLDYFGIMPKFLAKVSPFHGSMIITSMGSLGIGPIYHHLYDFGNLPIFISYGKRYSKIVIDENGRPMKRHFVGFRVVTDERICDGFYYASAFKMLLHYIKHPESLEAPPEQVFRDVD